MSKRPASSAKSSTSSGSTASKAKAPKPTLSMESLMNEISKMETSEDFTKGADKLHANLMEEWKKKERDMGRVGIYLEGAKVLLTKLEFLPLFHNPAENVREMTIARDILEIGAWYSILKCEKTTCDPDGIREFERYISKLKHYYFDLAKLLANNSSEHKCEILGMNLLNLLSQDKVTDFHYELEIFVQKDSEKVLNNPYIKKAVELEQFIMEGRYNKIYALKSADQEDLKKAGLTSVGFKYFINHLETTLKDHIAGVIGSAYDRLSMQSTMELLNLSDDTNRMSEIIKSQKWTVKEGYIYFHSKKDNSDRVPAEQMIEHVLKYADEMELIV